MGAHNHWCKNTCLSKGARKRNSRLVVCLELCYARERAGSGSYAWCLGGFTLFVRGNSTSSRDNYSLEVDFEEASLLPVSFYDFVKPFQGPFRWKWLMYFGPQRHLAARRRFAKDWQLVPVSLGLTCFDASPYPQITQNNKLS